MGTYDKLPHSQMNHTASDWASWILLAGTSQIDGRVSLKVNAFILAEHYCITRRSNFSALHAQILTMRKNTRGIYCHHDAIIFRWILPYSFHNSLGIPWSVNVKIYIYLSENLS